MIQFLVQAVGLLWLRATRPDFPAPFRMWLYLIPALLAILGFVYVLIQRPGAPSIIIIGTIIFLVRAWRTHEWPFGQRPQANFSPNNLSVDSPSKLTSIPVTHRAPEKLQIPRFQFWRMV